MVLFNRNQKYIEYLYLKEEDIGRYANFQYIVIHIEIFPS